MGGAEGSDVERALAALGGAPIAYRSFATEARRADTKVSADSIRTLFPLLAAALPETVDRATSPPQEAATPEPPPASAPTPAAPSMTPTWPVPGEPTRLATEHTSLPAWLRPPETPLVQPSPWAAPAEPPAAPPPQPAWLTQAIPPQPSPLPAWATRGEPPEPSPLPVWATRSEPPVAAAADAVEPASPATPTSAPRTRLATVFRILRGNAAPFRPAPEPTRGLHNMFRRL